MKNNEPINVALEMAYMSQYIQNNWTCPPDKPFNILALVQFVYDETNSVIGDYFDEYGFLDIYDQWGEWREQSKKWRNITAETKALLSSHDALYNVAYALLINSREQFQRVTENFDFSLEANKILKEVSKNFPTLPYLKPKHERELIKSYHNNELDNHENKTQFLGLNSAGAAHYGFDTLCAPHHAAYTKEHEGRQYKYILVQALITHSMAIIKHNNTARMLSELWDLKKHYDKPQFFQDLLYEIDMSLIGDPTLKAMLQSQAQCTKKLFPTPEQWRADIEQTIENIKKFNSLSPQEQQAIMEQNEKDILTEFKPL